MRWRRITGLLADPSNPRSLSARARARRWAEFTRRFPDLPTMEVLDLGGTPDYWRRASPRPRRVTLVNTDASLRIDDDWMRLIVADACRPPIVERFDLVVSNSLLEHIPLDKRMQFADSVRRHADAWWIQTPNRTFPLEPHWLFPLFQFLPFGIRTGITRVWPLGHRHARTRAEAAALVAEVNLVGATELRRYFPESEIWHERVAGLAKSLVAARSSRFEQPV